MRTSLSVVRVVERDTCVARGYFELGAARARASSTTRRYTPYSRPDRLADSFNDRLRARRSGLSQRMATSAMRLGNQPQFLRRQAIGEDPKKVTTPGRGRWRSTPRTARRHAGGAKRKLDVGEIRAHPSPNPRFNPHARENACQT